MPEPAPMVGAASIWWWEVWGKPVEWTWLAWSLHLKLMGAQGPRPRLHLVRNTTPAPWAEAG
ncbi:MAG: hypothetical protein QM742_19320 [Aquabacterium sp.]